VVVLGGAVEPLRGGASWHRRLASVILFTQEAEIRIGSQPGQKKKKKEREREMGPVGSN
jgi:hypothetical protein